MQTRSNSNVKVIDVSHHQGSINWSKVKADGVHGALIKATEGKTYIDLKFAANAAGAAAAELPIGFYHYARPELNAPEDEAANFWRNVKQYKATFPYALDVEGDAADLGPAKLTAWCVKWLQEVERLSGHPTMIYTGASFAKSYLGRNLVSWPLWIAHYGVNTPMSNPVWGSWAMFQYTSSGSVSGISGNVDVNAVERSFYDRYVQAKEVEDFMMKQKDAEAVIRLLSASHELTTDKQARDEIHRLANEVRKAAGMPVT